MFAARPVRVHLVRRVEVEVTPWLSWTDSSTAVQVSATPSGTILGLADETEINTDADDAVLSSAQKKAKIKALLGMTPKKALTVVGCSAEEVELALVAAALSAGGIRGAMAVIMPSLALGFRDNMVGDCLDIGILPSVQGAEVSVAAARESAEGLTNALNTNITQRMGWARWGYDRGGGWGNGLIWEGVARDSGSRLRLQYHRKHHTKPLRHSYLFTHFIHRKVGGTGTSSGGQERKMDTPGK